MYIVILGMNNAKDWKYSHLSYSVLSPWAHVSDKQ